MLFPGLGIKLNKLQNIFDFMFECKLMEIDIGYFVVLSYVAYVDAKLSRGK